jgi:hypothetical protein
MHWSPNEVGEPAPDLLQGGQGELGLVDSKTWSDTGLSMLGEGISCRRR